MSCIVVFRQPDRIILASDSREVSADESGGHLRTGVNDAGKIRLYGPWALTLCGFSKGPNGMDVREALGREVAAARTMADALAAVQRVFERRLLPSLALARRYPMFRDLFDAVGGAVLAVFVAGVDRDGTLTLGSFGADVVAMEPFECRMYGGTLPGVMGDGSRPFYFAVGQELAIALAASEERPEWLARGDAEAARRLLEMQIAATPRDVAPPIHVLEITRAGTEWCSVGVESCLPSTN